MANPSPKKQQSHERRLSSRKRHGAKEGEQITYFIQKSQSCGGSILVLHTKS
jgi:hypothetical protein